MAYSHTEENGYDDLSTLLKRYAKINWVVTSRDNEFVDEVTNHIEEISKTKGMDELKDVYIYDTVAGYQHSIKLANDDNLLLGAQGSQPLPPDKALRNFLNDKNEYITLIFRDAEALKDKNFWRLVVNTIPSLSGNGKLLLFMSPFEAYPQEYSRFIHVYHHKLPDYQERLEFVKNTRLSVEKNYNDKIDFPLSMVEPVAKATAGLTLLEIKTAIIRGVVVEKGKPKKGILNPDFGTILKHKEEVMEKTAKIKFLHSTKSFDDIGGLDRLKKYIVNRFDPKKKHLPKSGVILVGPPGTGKTSFAEALGNYLKVPSMYLNFSSIFNRLVGDSEKAMKAAIDILDTVGDSILVADEIEKVLGGVQSSNKSDGGTTNRVFELFLKWLNRKDRKVYVIATSNNIDELPPEFVRAGRWDSTWLIDYPSQREAKEIFAKKCKLYGINDFEAEYQKVNLENMTGAEIEQFVIEYCYSEDWREAANVTPKIWNTQHEKIKKARQQLGSKFISASEDERVIETASASINESGDLDFNLNGNN